MGAPLSDLKPEALLKSALEKILYFEARSSQLSNDADNSRSELERLRADLAAASQREIELRRVVAELEVRLTRAHSEREEAARLADALRRERAHLVGKMLEASRIHGVDQGLDDFDLAQFIAQLRSEVLVERGGTAPVQVETPPTHSDSVAGMAKALKEQGRLGVTSTDFADLTCGREFLGRSEETLFGFSVRELSAPDRSARVRACERLQALRHAAAAPALAAALHQEAEPLVQVALLGALASLAQAEAVPVVTPWLSAEASEVRVAALKAMLNLDPSAAAPYLAAATKDPDKAVRRRASLLALGLSGKEAFELGTQGIRDADPDVRSLAALVLGASNAEVARPILVEAMRDKDLRVRRAASQSLSRMLGQDVTSLVSLDDAQRRREVRRLAQMPFCPPAAAVAMPVAVAAAPAAFLATSAAAPQLRGAILATAIPAAKAPSAAATGGAAELKAPSTVRVAVLEEAPPSARSQMLHGPVMRELRASIRGRPVVELAEGIGASPAETMQACGELMAQGHVVRRGHKYFVA